MSYILDALKKTEDKRRSEKKIPDLYSGEQTRKKGRPKKPSYWPYLVMGALVVNAALLVFISNKLIFPEQEEKVIPLEKSSVVDKKEAVDVSVVTREPLQERAREEIRIVIETPPAVSGKTAVRSMAEDDLPENTPFLDMGAEISTDLFKRWEENKIDVQIEDDVRKLPQPIEAELDDPGILEQRNITELEENTSISYSDRLIDSLHQEKIESFQRESSGGLREEQAPITRTIQPKEREVTRSFQLDAPSSGEKTNGKSAGQNTKSQKYSHLPQRLRNELPDLTISLHFYSSTPKKRVVSINGKMRREGDKIEENLVLYEITKDGVVFSYKGERFLLGVF